MKNRIFDASHISSSGGIVIVELVLSAVSSKSGDILLTKGNLIFSQRLECVLINSEIERIVWYVKNYFKFRRHKVINLNSSLCIGSIFYSNSVYFHNVVMFDNVFKLFYQRLVLFLARDVKYYSQTKYANSVLKQYLNLDSELFPFFKERVNASLESSQMKRIFHISSNCPHKQNFFFYDMVDTFINLGYDLFSTLDVEFDPRINVINNISHDALQELFGYGGILLNTSKSESLCLPLIEAAQNNLTVVSYEAAYVREVVNDVYTFTNIDELKVLFLSEALTRPAKLVIENNLKKINNIL